LVAKKFFGEKNQKIAHFFLPKTPQKLHKYTFLALRFPTEIHKKLIHIFKKRALDCCFQKKIRIFARQFRQ